MLLIPDCLRPRYDPRCDRIVYTRNMVGFPGTVDGSLVIEGDKAYALLGGTAVQHLQPNGTLEEVSHRLRDIDLFLAALPVIQVASRHALSVINGSKSP
jgi:hypothetical protein